MANKRISELTSITGANLADADLLVVVDVSDTTMASSGTNKKITMSELAKDSALTDNLIAKTTLTTDGDVLTRAAGAPARITRADLAQDSAFSSRYAPTTDATLWINARDMASWTGTPAEAKHGPAAWNAWKLDASTDEGITFMAYIPTWWTTFHMDVYWANDGAGAGDVRWTVYRDAIVAGDTINSVGASASSTATADIEDDLVVSRVLTSITNTGGPAWWFAVMRDADNAADTLANDIGVLGVLLTRAS